MVPNVDKKYCLVGACARFDLSSKWCFMNNNQHVPDRLPGILELVY